MSLSHVFTEFIQDHFSGNKSEGKSCISDTSESSSGNITVGIYHGFNKCPPSGCIGQMTASLGCPGRLCGGALLSSKAV